MKEENKRRWFDKSSIADAASVQSDKELLKQVGQCDGVLKFIDVTIEPTDVTGNEMETFEVPFTISTASVDRDGDVIKQDGWELSEYMKNPVILWAHDTSEPPVAKSAMIFVDEATKSLRSVAKFPSKDLYPFGNMIGRMYLHGFLRGASVGFLPIDYEIDEARDGLMPTNFKKQKLLEWSAVPVPSNPEGLAQARSFGIDVDPIIGWAEKILDGDGALLVPRHLVEKSHAQATPFSIFITRGDDGDLEISDEDSAEDQSDEETEETSSEDIRSDEAEADGQAEQETNAESEKSKDNNVKTYVEWDLEDMKKEAAWDSERSERIKSVITFNQAHPDGTPKAAMEESWSGPKEIKDADTDELFRMCAWYDSENPDVKGSYKLPHHKADGDVLVWRGVAAAMEALMGARGGVDIPASNKRGVYNHLAKHYKAFDKEPPPFTEDAFDVDVEKVSSENKSDDGAFEIPDLGSFHAMVHEAVRVEMDELRDLIGRLTEGEKK